MTQLFRSPKYAIGESGDKYEREADKVSDHIMKMQGLMPYGESTIKESIQKKSKPQCRKGGWRTHVNDKVPDIVNNVVNSAGESINSELRSFMAPRFGYDFSNVKIHNDAKAHEAADAVNARAFTVGRNVVFGNGQYSPKSEAGRKLISHELTHLVQQGGASRLSNSKEKKAISIRTRGDNYVARSEWRQDRNGDLFYNTREEAERRMRSLESQDSSLQYRVTSFESAGSTKWRVEMREQTVEENEGPTEDLENARQENAEGTGTQTGTGGATRTFSLTFDDGPHSARLGTGNNRTERVLDTLSAKGIRAGFFVQTHAQGAGGTHIRGSSAVGTQLIRRMNTDGHTIGIHTGGTRDHEGHVSAQRAGRLEGELEQAKRFITATTATRASETSPESEGVVPTLVRPPFGRSNKDVLATYRRTGLTNLLWDIDGDPGGELSQNELKRNIRTGIRRIATGGWRGTTSAAPKIVILYHDIRNNTSQHIGALIDHIRLVTRDETNGADRATFSPP